MQSRKGVMASCTHNDLRLLIPFFAQRRIKRTKTIVMFGQTNLSVALTVAFVEVQGIEYSTPLACQSLARRHCKLRIFATAWTC